MCIFRKVISLIFTIIVLVSCKKPEEVIHQNCDSKPLSPIWGKWKELSFQKKLPDYKNFEKEWTISTNNDHFEINACEDITIEQWKKGAGCCGFLYYNLKNDTLRAGGFGGGKGCENIYCVFINGQLIIEKLTKDSLTLINDIGRIKYLKVK